VNGTKIIYTSSELYAKSGALTDRESLH